MVSALREDLLNPIPGANPGGEDLRYNPLYDQIKDARRQDDELSQGAWQYERKMADYAAVVKLAQGAIAEKSKDLQLAAWLTEALIHERGFAGLSQGLSLCLGLVERFWDSVYPALEDGDAELRAAPLSWMGSKLDVTVKSVPLVRDAYDWYGYKESRTVGYENAAVTPEQKKAREKLIKEGKLAPEVFDKAFVEMPKSFYAQAERDLDEALQKLGGLHELCGKMFGDAAPGFGKLRSATEEVRQTIHGLLQKKRETEPDPVEEVAAPVEPEAAAVSVEGEAASVAVRPVLAPGDPASVLAAAAAALRRADPRSPAPYLMIRGLRWGELRAAAFAGDATQLEPPPAGVRRQIKALALAGRWRELLDTAEEAMALPSGRAWLDLQRWVVEACRALGPEYQAIATAISSELRALLVDVPQLLTVTLMDDTPAANAETQAWLRELTGSTEPAAAWINKAADSFERADEALKAGREQQAFEILNRDLVTQSSGRGRFFRKLQMAQLCVSAGKEAIAQPLLEDLAAAIDNHKLDEWEERETVAKTLVTILKSSKRIQADAKEKQKLFERICRLDPSQALGI